MSLDPTAINNFIAFHKSEEMWIQNRELGTKISLNEVTFSVKKADPTYFPGKHVLQLLFPSYFCQLDLAFDSMMKRNQWYQALTSTSCIHCTMILQTYKCILIDILGYHHVDLVRCPELPNIEGECVVEVCHSSFKVWPVKKEKLGWEWKFSDMEHCSWHPYGEKLEVKCRRYCV